MAKPVFISYSHSDYFDKNNQPIQGSAIDVIRQTLESNGIDYWIDEKIYPGDPFSKNIGEAISNCSAFLFISSARSNASEWAQGEIHTAKERNKRIIPVKIDNCPYNSSYGIYLSHLDFIEYYKSKDAALTKLVRTLKDDRINVSLPNSVSFDGLQKEIYIGETRLSDKILRLFNSIDISGAIKNYIEIVNDLSNIYDKPSENQKKALKRFSEISELSNYNIQVQKLISLSTELENYIERDRRTNRFLLQLGLMMIYYWLGEIKVMTKIHQEIRDSKFELTFWEENGDSIKEVGLTTISVIASFLTKTNPGAGLKYGSMSGQQASKEHKERLRKNRKYFEKLRAIISALKFNG